MKAKSQKNREFPISKGKELKRPTSKASPSTITTIMDSEEHIVKDISLSSDKEMWEVVKRKRPHPVRDDGNGEELVELDGPPTKKLATAEAVAAALNKGFEKQRRVVRGRPVPQWRLSPPKTP